MKTTRNNPFRNLKFLAVLLASSLVLWGCDSTSPKLDARSATQSAASTQSGDSNSSVWSAQEFRANYSDNLAHVGSYLEAHDATFAAQAVVKQGVLDYHEERFGADSEEYESAGAAFDAYVAGELGEVKDLPVNVQEVVRSVDEAIKKSESQEAFQQSLSAMQASVQAKAEDENWSEDERRMALSHVVSMQETMSFVDANQSLYTQNGLFGISWKCIAGTVGGAITGALGFASTGNVWLIIAGAVGGGLSGGASHC